MIVSFPTCQMRQRREMTRFSERGSSRAFFESDSSEAIGTTPFRESSCFFFGGSHDCTVVRKSYRLAGEVKVELCSRLASKSTVTTASRTYSHAFDVHQIATMVIS